LSVFLVVSPLFAAVVVLDAGVGVLGLRLLRERAEHDLVATFPFVSHAPGVDPNPIFTRDQIVLGTFPEKPHPKDYDDGDKKGDDSGKKSEPTKKSSKDDDDEQPRTKTKRTEVERYRRPRREASESVPGKGLNIMLGIGGGLKFGGHNNPGNYGNFGGHRGR
jgi:hypothetical protein